MHSIFVKTEEKIAFDVSDELIHSLTQLFPIITWLHELEPQKKEAKESAASFKWKTN